MTNVAQTALETTALCTNPGFDCNANDVASPRSLRLRSSTEAGTVSTRSDGHSDAYSTDAAIEGETTPLYAYGRSV